MKKVKVTVIEEKTVKFVDWFSSTYGTKNVGLDKVCADFFERADFQLDECQNDTDHVIDVQKEELDSYDLTTIEEAKEYGSIAVWQLPTLLTHLCNHDRLEPGCYSIRVSW